MGLAWRPKYEGDEVALGVSLAFALHAIPITILVLSYLGVIVRKHEDEQPFVPKPVVAATLLKLGKPLDPNKLPDRIVPKQRTAPKQDLVASADDPVHKRDAGAPVLNAKDDDLKRLIDKSDPFAEDAGKQRPEIGDPRGLDSGTEPDPNKVKAGDMYAAQLAQFFKEQWNVPSVISQGEANRLCVTMQVNIDRMMRVWHVRDAPIQKSSNDLYDDSARTMLQKVMDAHTSLPQPPPEVAELYRGRTVNLKLGDGCR
jgi:hypothetical protein